MLMHTRTVAFDNFYFTGRPHDGYIGWARGILWIGIRGSEFLGKAKIYVSS